jgi:hypothetical protein
MEMKYRESKPSPIRPAVRHIQRHCCHFLLDIVSIEEIDEVCICIIDAASFDATNGVVGAALKLRHVEGLGGRDAFEVIVVVLYGEGDGCHAARGEFAGPAGRLYSLIGFSPSR